MSRNMTDGTNSKHSLNKIPTIPAPETGSNVGVSFNTIRPQIKPTPERPIVDEASLTHSIFKACYTDHGSLFTVCLTGGRHASPD